MVVLLLVIQKFYCINTREYTNIPSCRGKLVFGSLRLQEGIIVYTLVKLYNKVNLYFLKYKLISILYIYYTNVSIRDGFHFLEVD